MQVIIILFSSELIRQWCSVEHKNTTRQRIIFRFARMFHSITYYYISRMNAWDVTVKLIINLAKYFRKIVTRLQHTLALELILHDRSCLFTETCFSKESISKIITKIKVQIIQTNWMQNSDTWTRYGARTGTMFACTICQKPWNHTITRYTIFNGIINIK